jgi:ABC-type Fe3+-hydroxamate transport system substrate-binding protein
MKRVILLVALVLSVSACSTMSSLFGSANQLESIIAVNVAGTYTVTVQKDGKTIVTETWVCTQDAGKLTGCHKQ